MRGIGETIKLLREERRMSQDDLADALKVGRSTIAMYEGGKRKPRQDMLETIADYFNVDMDYLYGRTNTRNATRELPRLNDRSLLQIAGIHPIPDLSGLTRVPLLGSIACGEPIIANDEYEYVEIEEMANADFCVRAKGNSMTGAGISDGSLVFCKQTDEVDNGQIAVVGIGDEVTLKKFYSYGDTVVLRPCNPEFQEQVYEKDQLNEIHIIGKAMTCISRVN